jgi:hypothetical protein
MPETLSSAEKEGSVQMSKIDEAAENEEEDDKVKTAPIV